MYKHLVTCEIPNKLLPFNMELNEYDFILYHLYLEDETYRNYFDSIKDLDRYNILDNSAYEFFVCGQEFNPKDFMKVLKHLNPWAFITPDVLMDAEKTIDGTRKFLFNYSEEPEPISVLQGNSPEELIKCANVYKDLKIQEVAVPFHNSFFKEYGSNREYYDEYFLNIYNDEKIGTNPITEDIKYTTGRLCFIQDNYDFLINNFSHIHFLGSHCPFEWSFYKKLPIFTTMDTGYPVKCAMEGHELGKEPHKPNTIIDDFVNHNITIDQLNLIKTNIDKFRNC